MSVIEREWQRARFINPAITTAAFPERTPLLHCADLAGSVPVLQHELSQRVHEKPGFDCGEEVADFGQYFHSAGADVVIQLATRFHTM